LQAPKEPAGQSANREKTRRRKKEALRVREKVLLKKEQGIRGKGRVKRVCAAKSTGELYLPGTEGRRKGKREHPSYHEGL